MQAPLLSGRARSVAAVILLTVLASVAPAVGSVTENPQPEPAGTNEPPTMGDYSEARFQGQAKELPAEMAEAIMRDLAESPEEYLARAAAAVDAVPIVDALESTGVEVLGSRLEGTQLVVQVPSAEQAALVEAVGARAEIGEPEVPDYSGLALDALGDLVGGQGFSFTTKEYTEVCSVGFNGRSTSNQLHEFITAGHCIAPERTFGKEFYESRQSVAGAPPTRGAVIGTPIEGLFHFGNGADVGPVITASGWTPQAAVSTWGGSTGPLGAGNLVRVTDVTPGIAGAPVCKSGRTTGWTCGEILVVNESFPVYNHSAQAQMVNLTLTDVCMRSGDSGGSAVIGTAAFGIGTAGNWVGNCDRGSQPGAVSAFFPVITTDGTPSIYSTLTDWEISVTVPTPIVVQPSFVGDTIRGTLPGAGLRNYVQVAVDGVVIGSPVPDGSGAWSVAIPPSLQKGTHSYSIYAGWGRMSGSPSVTGQYSLAPRPAVQRISGPDRYDVAIQIARQAYPGTAKVAYLTNGGDYPDALSAAPAAVHRGGPLLLTFADRLPPAVAAELRRLQPDEVVLVGGPNSISPAVAEAVKAIVPNVRQLSGSGRYETSQLVVRDAFGKAARLYVATGQTFPDALSASAAAGSADVPVLLVQGSAGTLDAATRSTIAALGTTRATIAGGPNSVTPGIQSELDALLSGPVDRLDGQSRFDASIAVNKAAFSRSAVVYLATGYNFPDALAGGALAGVREAPLYIVPSECVPSGVMSEIVRLGATQVVLLGGPVSLSTSVEALVSCS